MHFTKKLLFDQLSNKYDFNARAHSITIHECILCSSHTPSSLFEGTEPLHYIGALQQILVQ